MADKLLTHGFQSRVQTKLFLTEIVKHVIVLKIVCTIKSASKIIIYEWHTCSLATRSDTVKMNSRIHRRWLGCDSFQQIDLNTYFPRDPFAARYLYPFWLVRYLLFLLFSSFFSSNQSSSGCWMVVFWVLVVEMKCKQMNVVIKQN